MIGETTGSDGTDAAMAAPCRIVLVEDDGPIRQRLAKLIADWEGSVLIAACATLGEALEVIATHKLDMLITDLKLPDGSGIDAIKSLAVNQPDAESMVISVLADERTVLSAIEAGASGYLHKDADSIDLIEAITDLMAGRSPISPGIARVLVRRLSTGSDDAPVLETPAQPSILTPRETDVLWGIAKGFTYSELADRLGMSRQTVPVHVRNIYRKLQASNRSEAVYEASRLGLIRL
jgi:DNA-binding NarL/FixJ family response regulator